MQAFGRHDFTAQRDDEISFTRNDTLKILNTDEDKSRYKVEFNGKEGYVPVDYVYVVPHSWFMGHFTREDAERCLLSRSLDGRGYIQPDGAFFLRWSETSIGEFTLSFKCGDGVQHSKVLRDAEGKYFLWVVKFDSLNDLVRYHRTWSVNRNGDKTVLTDPVLVVAKFDFIAADSTELTFKKNDSILVLRQPDQNWWKGKLVDSGDIGLFPTNYVEC